jgi:CxxC motif-containing protein (DUF1111 family)
LKHRSYGLVTLFSGMLIVLAAGFSSNGFAATDSGVRSTASGAGEPLANLTDEQEAFFDEGLDAFEEVEDIPSGLGPRFNGNSCAMCHSQPAVGGSSPFVNPQVELATLNGAQNKVPFFVRVDGPILEPRIMRKRDGTPDGTVDNVYTITGRSDQPSPTCTISQPDFDALKKANNLAFRIPPPLFGDGLIENIPDSAIIANRNAELSRKSNLGIAGRPNRNTGGDGTISRFGWKAQIKSVLFFAGQAYNQEMGVTSELFPQERDETPGCVFNTLPEDVTHFAATEPVGVLSDIELFADFTRFLAPLKPGDSTASTRRGGAIFSAIGCALCHTPMLKTSKTTVSALANQDVNLYSDLLLHHMGTTLADGITRGQGDAGPDEFRTAPLWGLGVRIFFLHDGRTTDLIEAIEAHGSPHSEAKRVVGAFNGLSPDDKQNLLDFLRSL